MAAPIRVGDLSVHPIIDIADQEWAADILLPDATPEALRQEAEFAPPETYNSGTGGLRLQFGGFLFEVEGRRILVDTGVGAQKVRNEDPEWNMRIDARFLDSLDRHGCRPEDVDVVVTTHAHVDHVGWLTVRRGDAWEPTFPNAQHVFARVELDHWLTAYRTDPAVNFGSTADSILPLLDRADVVPVEDGHQLAPGVSLRVYPGHTPGNSVVWLYSRGQAAVICGDTIHHPIQLRFPDWSSSFCADRSTSASARRALLDDVCASEALLIPNHFRVPPSRIAKRDDHFIRLGDAA